MSVSNAFTMMPFTNASQAQEVHTEEICPQESSVCCIYWLLSSLADRYAARRNLRRERRHRQQITLHPVNLSLSLPKQPRRSPYLHQKSKAMAVPPLVRIKLLHLRTRTTNLHSWTMMRTLARTFLLQT